MDGKEFAQAAHRLLQAEMHSRGRGTITEVEEALGMPLRTINRMRNENQLRVADLYNILDQLGIQTSTFFLRLEAEIKEGNLPSAPGGGGLSGLPRRSSRDEETLARLRDADEMRYNDPVAALRAVSDLRPRVTRATAHLYYAVGGSCYRSLDLFENARECLKIAFETAESERELATCQRRLAVTYVVTDPKAALGTVRKAHDLYTTSGDEVGRATTLVDMATYCRAMAQLEAAQGFAMKALLSEVLPKRDLVAAHQELALITLESGQRDRALKRLELALQAAEDITDRSTRANLHLLAARAYQSAWHYDQSIGGFGESFPFEALGVGLEKCQLLAEDIEGQETTMRALRAYCRHPAYQRALDQIYAVLRMSGFRKHTFDFSRVRKRWRDSRTRGVKILI